MNEKYHNNKDPYIQFLKNWLTQIMDENKTIFVDDYHIDEIVPSDRKSTRLNSSHTDSSRMPSSA